MNEDSSSPDDRPAGWILWHPHQGLYNWELLGALRAVLSWTPAYDLASRLIILADTLVLFARAMIRRRTRLGFRRPPGRARLPRETSLLYFDFGTHTHGRELKLMVDSILPSISDSFRAYGFEASTDSFERVQNEFAGKANVTLVHGALCFAEAAHGKVRLYKDSGSGLGDSIHRTGSSAYEEVPALRFSSWLREHSLDLRDNVCLIRMNIEGAEGDVILDLIDAGMTGYVDGYFGMWDDLSKIDLERDEAFRALLSKLHIAPFTFNGRDLGEDVSTLTSLRADSWLVRFRTKCIEYEVRTCVWAGQSRIERACT
jgi:FkbM family methyltransferase